MKEEITSRITKDLGIEGLTELLAEKLTGSDLHSLLLGVLKRRVSKLKPAQLMDSSRVTLSCDLDGRLLNMVERLGYETASEYEAVELSPVSPLGSVGMLTGLDQGNVLSTVRSYECASDPTIGLALECARRRKSSGDRKAIARLCTHQRVLRFPAPEKPPYTAHFKLFSLVTAGRDTGSFSFETMVLREHIGFYLSLVSTLSQTGFSFQEITVEISDTRVVSHLCSAFGIHRDEIRSEVRARDSSSADRVFARYSNIWPKTITKPSVELAQFDVPKPLLIQLDLLDQNVCAPLSVEHPGVSFSFNMQRLTGLGYYDGPCFHIKMKNHLGQTYMMADGGFVDWTQRLLTDTKERLMTSAIGTELLCRMFRTIES